MKHTVYQDDFNYRVYEFGQAYKPVQTGTLYDLYTHLVHKYAYKIDKATGTLRKASDHTRTYTYEDFITDLALKECISFAYEDIIEDEDTGNIDRYMVIMPDDMYIIESHHIATIGKEKHFYTLTYMGFEA